MPSATTAAAALAASNGVTERGQGVVLSGEDTTVHQGSGEGASSHSRAVSTSRANGWGMGQGWRSEVRVAPVSKELEHRMAEVAF